MRWHVIKFENGSNPYICKTEKELNKMKKKYDLELIKEHFWFAKERRK